MVHISRSSQKNYKRKYVYLYHHLDPIYTELVTTVQVLYLLEICCRG